MKKVINVIWLICYLSSAVFAGIFVLITLARIMILGIPNIPWESVFAFPYLFYVWEIIGRIASGRGIWSPFKG